MLIARCRSEQRVAPSTERDRYYTVQARTRGVNAPDGRPVSACVCCRSPGAQFGRPPKAPDGLPVAVPPLCGICAKHQGPHLPADLERRNKQHLEQWELDFERQQQIYEDRLAKRDAEKDRVISELQATIEKLKDEIRSTPIRYVDRNLDQQTVDDATNERNKSYAARERTYCTLAQLRVVHHDTGRGLCKCGASLDKCAETEILDGDQSFLRWEARQVQNIRRNGEYASILPQGHPGRINPRWSPPGEPVPVARR